MAKIKMNIASEALNYPPNPVPNWRNNLFIALRKVVIPKMRNYGPKNPSSATRPWPRVEFRANHPGEFCRISAQS